MVVVPFKVSWAATACHGMPRNAAARRGMPVVDRGVTELGHGMPVVARGMPWGTVGTTVECRGLPWTAVGTAAACLKKYQVGASLTACQNMKHVHMQRIGLPLSKVPPAAIYIVTPLLSPEVVTPENKSLHSTLSSVCKAAS